MTRDEILEVLCIKVDLMRVKVVTDGMISLNMERVNNGEALAYSEEDFILMEEELKKLKEDIHGRIQPNTIQKRFQGEAQNVENIYKRRRFVSGIRTRRR